MSLPEVVSRWVLGAMALAATAGAPDGRAVSSDPGSADRDTSNDEIVAPPSDLARRLYDDGIFSVVVTEFFDARHHDHFHLDLARYRVDGTR